MSGRGRGLFIGISSLDATGTNSDYESKSSTSKSENVRAGRGKLLQDLTIQTVSTDTAAKDSGLDSKSSGQYRQIGRGKLLEDLNSTFSKIIIGRGRAQLLQNIVSKNPEEVEGDNIQTHTRPGRAQVIQNLLGSKAASIGSGSQLSGNVSDPNKEVVSGAIKEVATEKLFNPENTHGSAGIRTTLTSNYIELQSDPEKGVFVYEVRYKPNIDSNHLRIKYLNEHRTKYGGTKTFDGVTLYLPIMLKDKLTTFVSKNTADNSEIEIRVLFKRKELIKDCIHLYNVLFDRVMKTLQYVRFDRKQFDPTAPKIIPQHKLEVWPGYVTAVDEYEGGLMLCCDVSHRLLCQKTVLEMLVEIYNCSPNQFQENAKKSLLGSVIITRYNNRTYRIDDICFEKNPQSTFLAKDANISYIDYYRTNHNIQIKDRKQPLLLSIKKQRGTDKDKTEDIVFCLIPEICYLTGLRDDMRSDFKLMREIATFTRVSPSQRLLALEKFYTNIENCPEAKDILQTWGLTLKQSCRQIIGRQMPEEQIQFAKKSFSAGPTSDFSKYATNNELLEVVDLRNWLIIHCKNDTKCAKSFFDHMERNSNPLGIKVLKPKIVVLDNDRVDTYVAALRKNIISGLQIVVLICPTSRDDRYAAIKKICCAELPIPSQVINARTLGNETKNRSIVQKIALQMNCKLGGTLWSVKIPFKKVMVCGIDSFHDPNQKGNSVAAFVSSLNSSYTKWYSKAIIQSKGEEIVNGLCSSFISALSAYEKENKVLPDNVIIYRDGVGDGQLQLCANYEIPQLEFACRKIFSNYSVKITFIVVQKRINTRFFRLQGQNFENPNPGTIVDSSITRRNLYDFFLVSQSVKQGTVSPSHYVVVRDDNAFNPDILQRLSYKLCFMYYNWPGTVRIPACCQYAHKMSYLIGQSIRKTTSEELATKLFYL